jgi:two-component system LytT family response regulator
LGENRPDVVYLDVQLRGGSGFDLLPAIRPAVTRVIFVTAHERYASQALESGAVGCLLKPVSAADLADALSRLRNPSVK